MQVDLPAPRPAMAFFRNKYQKKKKKKTHQYVIWSEFIFWNKATVYKKKG